MSDIVEVDVTQFRVYKDVENRCCVWLDLRGVVSV